MHSPVCVSGFAIHVVAPNSTSRVFAGYPFSVQWRRVGTVPASESAVSVSVASTSVGTSVLSASTGLSEVVDVARLPPLFHLPPADTRDVDCSCCGHLHSPANRSGCTFDPRAFSPSPGATAPSLTSWVSRLLCTPSWFFLFSLFRWPDLRFFILFASCCSQLFPPRSRALDLGRSAPLSLQGLQNFTRSPTDNLSNNQKITAAADCLQ